MKQLLVLRHDSIVVGFYDNKVEFAHSHFIFSVDQGQVIVYGKSLDVYKTKQITSKHSYSEKSYTQEEMIKDYIKNYLLKELERYDFNFYVVEPYN